MTDRDGTTHLVWLESHGSDSDTIAYCRIPRGTTTCANLEHLLPTCDETVAAPSRHRVAGEDLDGERPKVMVSPFGDVFIVTRGLCAWDWRTTQDPWHSELAIDREIVLHSADGGDTFSSSSADARALGGRVSTQPDPFDSSVSSSVYDAVNSRVVTVEHPLGSRPCCDNQDNGIYVLAPPESARRQRSRPALDCRDG